jgi:hypothetical protein
MTQLYFFSLGAIIYSTIRVTVTFLIMDNGGSFYSVFALDVYVLIGGVG